jgi:hypothetical protein
LNEINETDIPQIKSLLLVPSENTSNKESLGAQGSLGRQSHSRIEALFVPKERILREYLKVLSETRITRVIYHMENNYGIKIYPIFEGRILQSI